MNLLYLTFAYLPSTGGVQRSVHNLAAEFIQRGHDVTIATDGTATETSWFSILREPPADVFALRIPTPFHWGIRHRIRSVCRDFINLLALAVFCRLRCIQVVHCHLINADTRYALTLKKLLGVKVVITLRGGEFTHWIEGKPRRQAYVRQMLRSADAVTALSQAQLNDARSLEPALPMLTAVIPNPADSAAIIERAADSPVRPLASPYLIFCGRLEPMKSLETLLQAYHEVISQNPSFQLDLVVVGGGSLESQLWEQAIRGPAAARIYFLGERPYEECLGLIKGASLLVLPSRESEGCPNVLLEAMALGTPVIVSDYAPLSEMVTPGVNGEIFPRGDAGALQACLERLALRPELRQQYASAGMSYLNRRHRFGEIADAYEEIYQNLLPKTALRLARQES